MLLLHSGYIRRLFSNISALEAPRTTSGAQPCGAVSMCMAFTCGPPPRCSAMTSIFSWLIYILTSNSSLSVLLLDMPPSLPLSFPDWPPISLGWISFVLWLAHIVAFISSGPSLISALFVSVMAIKCLNSTIIIRCVGSNPIPTNPIPLLTPHATI